MATLLPLVETEGYDLVDVLLITIPASIVGILVMSIVMSRRGKELEQDPEYQRRLAAGEVVLPKSSDSIQLLQYAKRSVAIFLGAVFVICLFGFFEGLRPKIAVEDGGTEPLSVTPIIQMVMLTAAALIVVFAHVKAGDIPGMSIFRSGMVAMIALFGIAWMADTFIANNEDAIVELLGGIAENWPFFIAVSIFLVAALTTSQSAATRTMVPLGLAFGIGAGYMIAMWTAVVGVLLLPANGTQIAAAEADTTGTTNLGKRVIDHSFQLPLQICWIVTALVGIGIVALLFWRRTTAKRRSHDTRGAVRAHERRRRRLPRHRRDGRRRHLRAAGRGRRRRRIGRLALVPARRASSPPCSLQRRPARDPLPVLGRADRVPHAGASATDACSGSPRGSGTWPRS